MQQTDSLCVITAYLVRSAFVFLPPSRGTTAVQAHRISDTSVGIATSSPWQRCYEVTVRPFWADVSERYISVSSTWSFSASRSTAATSAVVLWRQNTVITDVIPAPYDAALIPVSRDNSGADAMPSGVDDVNDDVTRAQRTPTAANCCYDWIRPTATPKDVGRETVRRRRHSTSDRARLSHRIHSASEQQQRQQQQLGLRSSHSASEEMRSAARVTVDQRTTQRAACR